MAKKSSDSSAKSKPPALTEHWGEHPAEHDYPAAAAYLSLRCPPAEVKKLTTALHAAPLEHGKAKDLLRSSSLALLPPENAHVAADLAKVKRGTPLSPVL